MLFLRLGHSFSVFVVNNAGIVMSASFCRQEFLKIYFELDDDFS